MKSNPRLTLEANGYTYEIERKDDTSSYTVRDASGSLTLPIRYAFGAGNQTLVLQYQAKFYESMVSYYRASTGWRLRSATNGCGRATRWKPWDAPLPTTKSLLVSIVMARAG